MQVLFHLIESNDPQDFQAKVTAFYAGKQFASLIVESSVERTATGRLYWMHLTYALVPDMSDQPTTFQGD